jgi:hypothetical protein
MDKGNKIPQSVDRIQLVLAKKVFNDRQDAKKAAGRALGTMVEIISYYLLKTWGLERSILIERKMGEYGNRTITHNVEYSLHPILDEKLFDIKVEKLPVSVNRLKKNSDLTDFIGDAAISNNQLLSAKDTVRNACVIATKDRAVYTANLVSFDKRRKTAHISVTKQLADPFVMVECKRVGKEEGAAKGPQTIEKAKQGAYVARSVSSLQKIRHADGTQYGIIWKPDGRSYAKPYVELLREVIDADDADLLRNFVLTVGVVSNHGNWFSSQNMNKELVILADAYDWLLFLTDAGIAAFVEDLLFKPSKDYKAVKKAFRDSYIASKGNRFTKVEMDYQADAALKKYFKDNLKKIEGWFNIVSPKDQSMSLIKKEIEKLRGKDWKKISNQL